MNGYARCSCIGATSVISAAMRPGSKLMTDWLRALLQRKPRKVAAVALANKMARMAWALMTRGRRTGAGRPPSGCGMTAYNSSRNDWEWNHASSIDR